MTAQRPEERTSRAPWSRRAYTSLLMTNDSYLPGCLMCAYGLRRQGVRARLVCLVTPEVTARAREALEALYDAVVLVEEINPDPIRRGRRQALPRMFTRFAALRLGPDGDLGHDFDRVVLLDADLLPLRDFDRLWELDPPAGVINEKRTHMVALDEQGRIRYPSADRPQAAWHEVYGEVCPHGARIPAEITERVAEDGGNLGVNGALFVLEPSAETYRRFMDWLSTPPVQALIQERWPWPDMQAATLFWSGQWTSVDFTYSMLYGYPSLESARGLHFAGVKPWSWRKRGFERRIRRYADYRLWAETYLELLSEHPELEALRRLAVLRDRIRGALRDHESVRVRDR